MNSTAVPLLPLVRHASARLTPWLLRTPLSANQVTTLSLIAGLASAAWLATGTWSHQVWAGLSLIACYVLDNCDGEIARTRGQCSRFGKYYDTAVDWLVHTALFVALGYGQSAATGEPWWWYAGLVAGAGGTINYLLGLYFEWHDARRGVAAGGDGDEAASTGQPRSAGQWMLFIFRELTRADFCFLVLLLALADLLWFLLPAGAVGAQVYWLTLSIESARRYHV